MSLTPIDKEKRKQNYKLFYTAQGLSEEKILAKQIVPDYPDEGYMCVCIFCNSPKKTRTCGREKDGCCITGLACPNFVMNEDLKNKYKTAVTPP